MKAEKREKETIDRDFALAKELHGFRYTQEYGQARMAWKAALAFAWINLKKLARVAWSTQKRLIFPALLCIIYMIWYLSSKRRRLSLLRAAFVHNPGCPLRRGASFRETAEG